MLHDLHIQSTLDTLCKRKRHGKFKQVAIAFCATRCFDDGKEKKIPHSDVSPCDIIGIRKNYFQGVRRKISSISYFYMLNTIRCTGNGRGIRN